MTTIKVEIKAVSAGTYGQRAETALVLTDLGWYLIQDEYCGEARMEGGTMRPHIYKLTDRQADLVRRMYNSESGEFIPLDERSLSVMETLVYDAGLTESQMLGRAIGLTWGKQLCESAGMVAC